MLKFRIPFCLFILTICHTLFSADSIKREGEPFMKSGVKWQHVRYEGEQSGFTADFPGIPKCGINKDSVVTAMSTYRKTRFAVITDTANLYSCPVTESAFLRQVREAFSDVGIAYLEAIPSNQKTVRYIALITLTNRNFIWVFSSYNHLYYAVVADLGRNDSQLVKDFYDSIQIIK